MGKITKMQILYLVMQWKPHSCILQMITNLDTKCMPTEACGYWNQWGMIGIQSESWGVSITKKYLHMCK